jgi:LCP family protein required for cell wall assembly
VSDRFQQPERATPSDPRRVFIPPPSDGGGPGGPAAPPRPRPEPSPAPGFRPPGGPPGRGRAIPPGGPPPRRDPFAPERDPGGPGYGVPGGPPEGPGRRRPRFPRLRWRRVLLVVAILLVVCLVGTFLWVRSMFGRIERVETDGELSSASAGTNYLIVGSDSREVVQGSQAGVNDGDFPSGQRADTMLVLHVEGGETRMLSIPRDLYVTIADTNEGGKINGAYNGGAPRLLRTIKDNLDLPIDRYIEVDFVSFAGLVDSLGGITLDIPHPATDANSGLNITGSGQVELDGEQALAYVRSRHYVEHIDGEQVPDPTGDLGRITRQQQFLTAVFAKLSDTKNPISLLRAFDKTSKGLRIDDEMGLFDAVRLGWKVRGGLDPSPEELPTEIGRNEAGSVLFLKDEAQPILEGFR